MQSVIKDGIVHYISKVEDFQELVPYEVYEGIESFLQARLNIQEAEYEDSLSAVRSDLAQLDEAYDKLEAKRDDLELKLEEAEAKISTYENKFGEL